MVLSIEHFVLHHIINNNKRIDLHKHNSAIIGDVSSLNMSYIFFWAPFIFSFFLIIEKMVNIINGQSLPQQVKDPEVKDYQNQICCSLPIYTSYEREIYFNIIELLSYSRVTYIRTSFDSFFLFPLFSDNQRNASFASSEIKSRIV